MLGEPKGARGRRALILVENLSVPFDRRVWQECRTLRDAGWEVDVICPRGAKRDTEPEAVIDGVRIHRYPLRAATGGPAYYLKEYGAALWHTARLARKVGPVDVVHACNPPDLLFLPALRLKRQGAKFVFDQHDLVPELYLSRFGRGKDLLYRGVCALERATYRAADVVLATNESYKDVAVRRGGRRPEDVFVVRSAPDTERFHPVDPEPELKRGKPHLLCYLGVMGPQDGVDYALRALAKLRDEQGRTDWHAVFVGAGDTFDAMLELSRSWGSTARWSSRDACRTPTWCAGCPPRTCASPRPVQPAQRRVDHEQGPRVHGDGKPIVSFDLKEARVSAGEAAVYAKGDDEGEFAALIARLLDDPEQRARMGKFGQERINGPLAWRNSQAALLAAYEAAVSNGADAAAPSGREEARP